ncbi:DNA-directed RNA polymerase subunit H [Candidatus Woesearchaeota archaeon]|nr:DNA-directed RNA polymerase subunit H [Candidatus Woesearchaeota archaeon]
MKKKIDVKKHVLVPRHQKLSEREKDELLQRYAITTSELPRIIKTDPVLAGLNAKPGDVLIISRKSATAGASTFYRVVVNG